MKTLLATVALLATLNARAFDLITTNLCVDRYRFAGGKLLFEGDYLNGPPSLILLVSLGDTVVPS